MGSKMGAESDSWGSQSTWSSSIKIHTSPSKVTLSKETSFACLCVDAFTLDKIYNLKKFYRHLISSICILRVSTLMRSPDPSFLVPYPTSSPSQSSTPWVLPSLLYCYTLKSIFQAAEAGWLQTQGWPGLYSKTLSQIKRIYIYMCNNMWDVFMLKDVCESQV